METIVSVSKVLQEYERADSFAQPLQRRRRMRLLRHPRWSRP
jgi:hypothetical protein